MAEWSFEAIKASVAKRPWLWAIGALGAGAAVTAVVVSRRAVPAAPPRVAMANEQAQNAQDVAQGIPDATRELLERLAERFAEEGRGRASLEDWLARFQASLASLPEMLAQVSQVQYQNFIRYLYEQRQAYQAAPAPVSAYVPNYAQTGSGRLVATYTTPEGVTAYSVVSGGYTPPDLSAVAPQPVSSTPASSLPERDATKGFTGAGVYTIGGEKRVYTTEQGYLHGEGSTPPAWLTN